MTTLQLHFLDDKDKKHIINFYIYNSSLANRWIDLTKQNQERSDKQLTTRFTNASYTQIDRVRKKLVDCVKRINTVYDEPLPTYDELDQLLTPQLNYLHEEFERYGDRYQSMMDGPNWTKELHEDFLQLNELIHLHEDVNISQSQKFPSMALLYDYYPQEIHSPILESDKIWITSQFRWGDVYLGYNTLGKDWIKVQMDNDIEVVEREHVRPQRRFAAETWINFGPQDNGWFSLLKFEKWVESLSDELRSKVPMNDLNELSLGRFRIGQIIIDDYFLKYNSDPIQWQLPDSQAKLDWNLNVFSTFVELKDVRIYD